MNHNLITLLPRWMFRLLRSGSIDRAGKPIIVIAVIYFAAQIVRGLL